MAGRIGFEVKLGSAGAPRDTLLRRSDTMRILVLGDFSGRPEPAAGTPMDLSSRPILPVDVDNFDAVLGRLSPGLALAARVDGSPSIALQFETLDDFHPDHLYASLESFRKLRESRARLFDPLSFEEEASRLMEGLPPASSSTDLEATPVPPRPEDEAGLLQRLIGTPAESASRPAASQSLVDGLIRRLVQPHIKSGSTRSPAPYVEALDAASTELMRALLHDAGFQAIESAWRGVRRLVESLDLGDTLTLHIVDISKDELLADLVGSGGDPQQSVAHRLLAEASRRGADAQPWSLLVGLYSFGANADDIALLGHLGVIASRAGGPLLAAAEPSLAGCERLDKDTEPRRWTIGDPDVERLWSDLRRSPIAPWLGLALPGILLRLPYGAKTDPIERFAFEEFSAAAGHEAYLWGNPSLACAEVIARAFLADGPNLSIEGPQEIDDLPAHVRDQDGERRLQPCAEFLLPVRVGQELLQRGLIPLLSYGNRNAVRVMGVPSIAEPPGALAGLG
jgi:type VI secretion system protein ImpC